MLKALIFDVDGTLAETERDLHRVAFNETFIEYHLHWHWSETLYGELLAVTGGKERIKFYVQNYLPHYPLPANLEAFVADLHKRKTQRYHQLLVQAKIALRPGVQRLLEEARQEGLVLAIATTTSLSNVTTLLEHSLHPEAMRWFHTVAAGDSVVAKKPAPDIYHYALQQLQLPATACLAIEDSRNGLQAAVGAKVPTLITVNAYTRQEDFHEALVVLDHLGEPQQPFQVLEGSVNGAQYVDVALLRWLHAQAGS